MWDSQVQTGVEPMTEVVFLSSLQGYQASRIESISRRLKTEYPDLKIEVLDGSASGPLLENHKLKFGPAILIDGRIEFVGVPRYRMLVERIATARTKEPAPRSVMRPATPDTKPGSPRS